MASLNPIVTSDIGYEQPVATPSVLSSVLQLGSQALGNIGAPAEPRALTSAEIQNQALTPYAQRLEELRSSDLTDEEFTRQARLLERQFLTVRPELASEAREIAGNYGVETPELAISAGDSLTAARNEWLETPAGIAAIERVGPSAMVEGQLDEALLGSLLDQEMASDLSLTASVERSNRELALLENDVQAWQAGSERAMGELLPQFTDTTVRARSGLIAMAMSGDTSVDTPEEQIAYLRRRREQLRTEFLASAQSANIHYSVYNAQLDTALQPIDDLINMFESSAGDTATILEATRNARTLQFENELVESFGAWAAHPEFMRQAATLFAGQMYDRDTIVSMVGLLDNQAAVGGFTGLDFMPSIPPASDAYASGLSGTSPVNTEIAATIRQQIQEDPASAGTTISSAIRAISGAEGDTSAVFRNFANVTAVTDVAGIPLGTNALTGLFSPTNVRTYATAVQGTDQESQDFLSALRYFQASQIARNQSILEGALTNHSNLSVEFRRNQLVILENGQERPLVAEGQAQGSLGSLEQAVRNINTINTAMRRIDPDLQSTSGTDLEGARQLDFMNGIDPSALSISGGESFYQMGGGAGEDTLGAIPPDYFDRIMSRESGGDPNARNPFPGQTATGLFQFTQGTWAGLMRNYPELGLTPDGRTNPEQQYRAVEQFTRDNIGVLQRNNIPINNQTLYGAHFLGAGGLVNVLSHSGDTPLSSILSAEVISVNPPLRGMTVDGFRGWLARMMGGPAPEPTARPSGVALVAEASAQESQTPAGGGVQTPAQSTQGATESVSQRQESAPVREGTSDVAFASQRTAPASQESGSGQTQTEAIARARASSSRILALLGRTEENVPQFSSEEELDRAVQAGEVNPEDVVLVAGEVRVA